LDVSAVNPAEFSEVCRPDWGPGFGFVPFENASKTVFVVAGVRSSCFVIASTLTSTESGRRAHIEIVVHGHHRRIAARALALDFNHGELPVFRRLSGLDPA
jgi:hypothetical protein